MGNVTDAGNENKLYEIIEQADVDATHLLFKAEKNENDGRAIVQMLRAQGTALVFVETRLRAIEAAIKDLQIITARETSKLMYAIFFVGMCIVIAIVSR